ncbi:hypothetical protein LCGC14_0683760 [marine sediment metagenome]|uniref:Uncharacterized protein n=1 Tax=marine sediment metagenome TaxID=412755 RepID=A0A0F9QML2_9ZZZZ
MPTLYMKDLHDDEDDVEMVEEYKTAELGLPQEADIPEKYDLLAALNLPEKGRCAFEYLPAGIRLGQGWKAEETIFDHTLVARAAAFQRCATLGHPTRVILQTSKGPFTICLFYRKEEKVFIVVRVSDEKILEQEVLYSVDEVGKGEIKVTEVTDDEGSLGKENTFKGLGYQVTMD